MKPCVGGCRSTESIGHWTCFPSSCTEFSVHCTLYWAHVLSTLFIVFCSLYSIVHCSEYIDHCILFIVHCSTICTLHTPEYSEAISCTQSCRCKNEVHVGQHLIILKPQQIKITTKLGKNITNSCQVAFGPLISLQNFENFDFRIFTVNKMCWPVLCCVYIASSELFVYL